MSIVQQIIKAARLTLILWLLTAIIYPFFILAVGQAFFPYQANGSLVTSPQGQVMGSSLIGQPFPQERYFSSRPSTVDYSTNKYIAWEEVAKTGISGASNLAPSNPELFKRIQLQLLQIKQTGFLTTSDLVYTSASGLDPHITVEAALAQIERVARSRNLPPQQLSSLIKKHTQERLFWLFGEPRVNVLALNRDLDSLKIP